MILFERVFLHGALSALFFGSLIRSLGIRRKMMFVVMPLFGFGCWAWRMPESWSRDETNPTVWWFRSSIVQLEINQLT